MMHEWTVPAVRGPNGRLDLPATLAAFERHFADTCGHRPRETVEVVNLRVRAIGRSAPPASIRAERSGLDDARPASREVWFLHGAGPLASAVLQRAALATGTRVAGPAVIEQHEATTLVPPGWSATVDTHGNLLIEPDGR
jgi:N-methylhydantoinase A/oxoprolinase/acetone carboxylase beta subunit